VTDDKKLEVVNRWCGNFYTSLAEYRTDNGGYWYGFLRYGVSMNYNIRPEVIGPGTAETVIIHEAYKLVKSNVWEMVQDIILEAS